MNIFVRVWRLSIYLIVERCRTNTSITFI